MPKDRLINDSRDDRLRMESVLAYMRNDKTRVAFLSLLASITITLMNFTAWLLTGSLAVLAETMHTFLDILITTITLIAVSVGSKPPDKEHPFGHGKAESLGGLLGSLFIIIAGILVGYESAERVITRTPFSPDIIAAIIMAIAIAIDFNRSRALRNAAVKWNSRALEADAYHFMSDMAISASVIVLMIVGIIMERLSIALFDTWGTILDALVSFGIVIYFSIIGIRLLRTAIDELMDRASEDLIRRVSSAVMSVPGVTSVRNIRARRAGYLAHIEVTIGVSDHLSISEAHGIADKVESAIKREIGPSLIMVHVEPELREKVEKALAMVNDPILINIHELDIINTPESGIIVSLHAVVRSDVQLDSIRDVVNKIERSIKNAVPNAKVWIHIEPDKRHIDVDAVKRVTREIVSKYGGYIGDVYLVTTNNISIMRVLVYLPPNIDVITAHNIATEIENEIAKVYSMPHHIIVSVLPASK
ncbi:MAG: cation diffusion facilitator family transporter [Vulcanisaeta sp.]